jgi:hypothetical protein
MKKKTYAFMRKDCFTTNQFILICRFSESSQYSVFSRVVNVVIDAIESCGPVVSSISYFFENVVQICLRQNCVSEQISFTYFGLEAPQIFLGS